MAGDAGLGSRHGPARIVGLHGAARRGSCAESSGMHAFEVGR